MKEETEIALLKKGMEDITKKIDEHSKQNASDFAEIKEMIKEAMDTKAGVWVENAMRWFIYTVMGVVVVALIYTIIKK